MCGALCSWFVKHQSNSLANSNYLGFAECRICGASFTSGKWLCGVSLGRQRDVFSLYPVEFLNSLELSGVYPHNLKLEVVVLILLMRDLGVNSTSGTKYCKSNNYDGKNRRRKCFDSSDSDYSNDFVIPV